jgi:DNA-binding transcriptional LysR family regulator
MELRHLRYFLAVAEELHFHRAARKLHVAQPALSRQIGQMEAEIGAKLFERNSQRVRLTPAGEAFLARARNAVDQVNRGTLEAGQLGRGEAGTVLIGFVSTATFGVLPALLHRFRRIVPLANIELLELEPAEQLREIREQRLDLGMMHARLNDPQLSTVVIARDRLIVALPKNHVAAKGKVVDLRTLSEETFLLPAYHATVGFHELVLNACRVVGFIPKQIQPTRLLQTAIALVAGGVGVALVPQSFRKNMEIKGIAYRSLADEIPVAELIAVWRTDNAAPLFVKLRDELKAVLPNRF